MLNENPPTNEIKLNQVLHGKNQDVLKDFPDSFFDSVITDPPYELNFMSKAWDASGVAYNVTMWKEVLRVAKPGATLFCFGGTRTYHRVACAIEDAGWQLKDSLMWIYGSGFPKSLDISKALDKEAGATREVISTRKVLDIKGDAWGSSNPNAVSKKEKFCDYDITEPATDIAKQWAGYGTALKPAFEPIILAQKPLEKGLTYAQNARKWGVAGLNIDAGRISTSDKLQKLNGSFSFSGTGGANEKGKKIEFVDSGKGRWPANVILSHSPDCVQVGTGKVKCSVLNSSHTIKKQSMFNAVKEDQEYHSYADENGQETIDVYACVPNCPIRIMDTQSGQSKSMVATLTSKPGGIYGNGQGLPSHTGVYGHNDSGGASRFFYTAKASRSERESGLKDFVPCAQCGEFGTEQHTIDGVKNNCIRNNHPTIKPVSIMKYLCELIKMPARTDADGKPDASKAQVILDPFCGSGTTLLAADEVGLKYIGIDMGFDNVLIASSRSIETPPDDELTAPVDAVTLASSAAQLTTNDFNDLII